MKRAGQGRIASSKPAIIVCGAALLVVLVSFLSSLGRRIGVVEPHVWGETTRAETGGSGGTSSRYRAVQAAMNGEVSRTAERLREVTALAGVAALFAVTEKGKGRSPGSAGELLARLSTAGLLPPGLSAGAQSGTLVSAQGTLLFRYRPSPLGIEVISLGRDRTAGPSLMVRLPGDDLSGNENSIWQAGSLDQITIPRAFASAAEIVGAGWLPESLPKVQ